MLDHTQPDDSTAHRLAEDDRAVSEIIGAMLVFGILIALLVLIQVSAVPAWNQQVEYEHNKRVQEDIQELGSTLTAASADGNDRSTVVEMGVQYPSRPFLFNPPAAGATLETVPETAGGASGSIIVSNASVTGVDNYPYGVDDTIRAPTKAIRYRPNYDQYGNAPVTVVENGVVYNRYDDAVLTMDDGNIVNGSNINLVAVDGELSETAAGPRTIRTQATSGPARTVTVESRNGNPIYVRVPTLLDESEWDRILGDQPNVTDTYVDGQDRLVIRLRPGTYSLRMAEVGFGPNVGDEPASYITGVEGGGETVLVGTTTTLTAEVRDRYNNPVANEEVTISFQSGGGTFLSPNGTSLGSTPIQATTDADGQVSVRYRPANGTNVVRVSGDFDGVPATAERTDFTVTASSTVGGGENSDAVSAINPDSDGDQVYLDGVNFLNSGQGRVQLCFANNANRAREFTAMRISYYFGAPQTSADIDGIAGTPDLEIPGDFTSTVALGDIPAGTAGSPGSESVVFDFGSGYNSGDFFILTVQYDNPTQKVTYFVGLREFGC